jgi:hypothetical protein
LQYRRALLFPLPASCFILLYTRIFHHKQSFDIMHLLLIFTYSKIPRFHRFRMDRKKSGRTLTPIECFVNTGSDLVPIHRGPGSESQPGAAPVTYGQYLSSVACLLSENSCRVLKNLLNKQPTPTPKLEAVSRIELIGEKQGALYAVSRLRLHFADSVRSFAVNCAFSPEQQAFLKVDVKLLSDLHAAFGLPYLPLPFITASASGLKLFIAEWFENHSEFHLSKSASGVPAICVWRQGGKPQFLGNAKTGELYAQASKILTSYLDTRSFSQIYPWHHGAGDFIVDETQNPLSLRLITVRGYKRLLARKSDCRDKMLGALHFFVNLGIRMRIDRLDGTGELAWAGPQCLPGVVRGFAQAWEARLENTDLPKAGEIFSLFLELSTDEKLEFVKIAAADGRVEADEDNFLFSRLPGHVDELSSALKGFRLVEGEDLCR